VAFVDMQPPVLAVIRERTRMILEQLKPAPEAKG
jgi:hypothetical protein